MGGEQIDHVDPTGVRLASMAVAEMSVDLLLSPQLKYLSGRGYQVEALSKRANKQNFSASSGDFARTHISIERELSPLRDLNTFLKLVLFFKRRGYGIVNTHTPKAGLLGPIAAQVARIPVVIHTVHGFLFHDQLPFLKRMLFWAVEKFTATFSDYLFFQSREDYDWAVRRGFVPSDRAFYIGNGIDIRRFDPQRKDLQSSQSLRQEMGIPESAIVIGTVGRLVYEKGFREFFEVIRRLHGENPNLHFVIVGGEEKDQNDAISNQEMRELSQMGRVHFLGARTDVDAIYRTMDVFVLLSHREGVPRALMEAQAMEVPAVATRIRGCREVVEDGTTGLLVPLKNPEAAREAICQLIEDPALRSSYGRAARERISKIFREELVHGRIDTALQKILRRSSQGVTRLWQ